MSREQIGRNIQTDMTCAYCLHGDHVNCTAFWCVCAKKDHSQLIHTSAVDRL